VLKIFFYFNPILGLEGANLPCQFFDAVLHGKSFFSCFLLLGVLTYFKVDRTTGSAPNFGCSITATSSKNAKEHYFLKSLGMISITKHTYEICVKFEPPMMSLKNSPILSKNRFSLIALRVITLSTPDQKLK